MIGSIGEFILRIVCLEDVREASQTIRRVGSHGVQYAGWMILSSTSIL